MVREVQLTIEKGIDSYDEKFNKHRKSMPLVFPVGHLAQIYIYKM
jgi:hypothetical protein